MNKQTLYWIIDTCVTTKPHVEDRILSMAERGYNCVILMPCLLMMEQSLASLSQEKKTSEEKKNQEKKIKKKKSKKYMAITEKALSGTFSVYPVKTQIFESLEEKINQTFEAIEKEVNDLLSEQNDKKLIINKISVDSNNLDLKEFFFIMKTLRQSLPLLKKKQEESLAKFLMSELG
jgi:hypothetical protein